MTAIPQTETARMLLTDLLPAGYNPRKMTPAAMAGLKASLSKFGELGGIVFNRRLGRLAGGHQRVKALVALGETHADVRVVDLDETDEKALNLTLNNAAIGGDWAEAQLAELLGEAQAVLGDMFTDLKLDALWAFAEKQPQGGSGGDPDAAPEPTPRPVSRLGDVWLMGDHRLICGDSMDAATVGLLLQGGRASLVFTDPPYGVSFQSRMSKGGTSTRFAKLKNDDTVLPVAPRVWDAMGDDTAAFIWTSQRVYPTWREQFAAFYKSTIIWYKPGGGIGDLAGDYLGDYEMALFCVKGRPKFRGKRGMAVWKMSKDAPESYVHPTQKPVELAERAIFDFSDSGAAVLDLFSGSGSTLIACERTARRCRASELDPAYVDVAVRRWQTFTGKAATLDGDGRTFDAIAAERLAGAA